MKKYILVSIWWDFCDTD